MADNQLKSQLQAILFADTEKFWLNLHRHKYHQLLEELASWELLQSPPKDEQLNYWQLLQTIAFLRHKIERLHEQLEGHDADYQSFVERLGKAELATEKQLHILKYAETLGASGTQLQQDKQAFSRWFDEGAVIGRYQTLVADLEQDLRFFIAKLGALTNRYLRLSEDNLDKAWKKLDLQPFFLRLMATSNNAHVRHGMIRALVNQVSVINEFKADPELDSELVAELIELLDAENTPYQAVVDILEILIHQRPTFVRSYMWAYVEASESDSTPVQKRNDQLFIVAAMPRILANKYPLAERDIPLLRELARHPFARVRQVCIEQLPNLPDGLAKTLLEQRFADETVDAVRFTLVKQLTAARFAADGYAFKLWRSLLLGQECLEVKRMLLEQSPRLMLNQAVETPLDEASASQDAALTQSYIKVLNQALDSEPSVAVRRYVTRTREQLISFTQQSLHAQLAQQLAEKETVYLPGDIDQDTLGRALSMLAQHEQSFNAYRDKQGWRIVIGYKRRRRFWRIWHEFFSPSTDKRQSFSHTSAKIPSAQLHVPTCTTAEISATNVPGEALYHLKEASARPHLPLPDYLLSVLSQDHLKASNKNYTPDGILVVSAPKHVWQRVRAYWQLSVNYAEIDGLRKGNELEQQNYLARLRKLGFSLEFQPYGTELNCEFPVESGITKLFARAGVPGVLVNLGYSFKEYLYSIYQNSIGQLVFFVSTFIVYFWLRHVRLNRKIRSNRAKIPVTIGGWGTRGKSGTERLKAALFSSLALRVVTKTTGCEAMMIFARSSGEQYELPLFRPFDKASIWEQSDVLDFARSVRADVFLWECMGLTPRYVRILRRWMRDNFTTITNTYPDHEDILGPSGVDVAQEMAAFIGSHTQIFTAEQTMAPILNRAAEHKQSTLIQLHWGDGFQITPDIRALYPYEEHPDNIALVCKMAQYIGIDKDYVYKETAERIVPDVGVLQHFTAAPVDHLTQSFVNSMSANERLATLENWRRLGLFELNDQPKTQTIALLNNRNDRVARSKVFAQVLIEDLSFDHIVVVGSNVDGFEAYLDQALDTRIGRLTDNNDKQDLIRLLAQWKCDATPAQFIDQLNALLDSPWLETAHLYDEDLLGIALTEHIDDKAQQRLIQLRVQNWQLAQSLLCLDDLTTHHKQLERVLSSILHSKLLLLDNPHITADELTSRIARLGLTGQHQLIVGMQNIKGPGLNYVYAWQHWHTLHASCERLLEPQISHAQFRRDLNKLTQLDKVNRIERDYFSHMLQTLSKLPQAQSEFAQAELSHLAERLTQQNASDDQAAGPQSLSGLTRFVLQVVESFLDAGAAVKRKKTAQQVYRDIATQRITPERAISVLAALNRGQKPGWLTERWLNRNQD
ncbi:poly-gamma-glutamate synthase PgsB [Pseudoalteromonas sp. OOF1S-7]|uniref:poly-gamma-glutamate synthase PgsB n=1 Tax=Pseudoalteromonas sp. OOF1S-7 TaxID=2917757 RepID=UPI001EF716E9|nr:poly-gamma-glutamate synthase PgsB [Pseudoalteromonas sp. OOF1S-7]MCG7536439.1 poly-gamma-glutamate synthase PgsB [Pseudoalteromonas sp. OOF1S-7]